ncbi:MAG: glycerol-3-phosphate dehydrogenase [Paramarteilia canceri]
MNHLRRGISSCVVGSGNWGSTIGKVLGENTKKYSSLFNEQVNMYVYEEQVNNKNLSEIINTEHENVKYLPGIKLPKNLIAITDIVQAVKDSDIIFLVLPFQFIKPNLEKIKSVINKDAYAITLAKGVYFDKETKNLTLISQMIKKTLGIPCYSMMGANIAIEVAKGNLCETTLGCDNAIHSDELIKILSNDNFLVQQSNEIVAIEMLGALKNIYAFGYGLISGSENVTNCTLSSLLRMSMVEMLTFIQEYCKKNSISFDDLKQLTMHSCSYSDLIASSLGGRNSRMGKLFSTDFYKNSGQTKTISEYEAEHLNGQKIQGTLTAEEVVKYLKSHNLEEKYPLMVIINDVANKRAPPHEILNTMRKFKLNPNNIK